MNTNEAHISPPNWREAFSSRVDDYRRHFRDLQTCTYELKKSREEREQQFRVAFDLTTPVAISVLHDVNSWFLQSTGVITSVLPQRDELGGLVGRWELSWPLLAQSANRFTGEPIGPIRLCAVFPLTPSLGTAWTHPHLALPRKECREGLAAAFPFQVTSMEDAWRQEPILRVLAEAELHECTFVADSNWRVLLLSNE